VNWQALGIGVLFYQACFILALAIVGKSFAANSSRLSFVHPSNSPRRLALSTFPKCQIAFENR
jgi:hypothetical protein